MGVFCIRSTASRNKALNTVQRIIRHTPSSCNAVAGHVLASSNTPDSSCYSRFSSSSFIPSLGSGQPHFFPLFVRKEEIFQLSKWTKMLCEDFLTSSDPIASLHFSQSREKILQLPVEQNTLHFETRYMKNLLAVSELFARAEFCFHVYATIVRNET